MDKREKVGKVKKERVSDPVENFEQLWQAFENRYAFFDVRGVDWKENEHMAQDTFCDEFMLLDCRFPENCKKAVEGCEWCFNLAVRSLLVWRSPACEGAWRVWRVRGPVFPVARLCQSGEVGCVWKGCTPQAVLHILCRPTWAAWASFSPITLASSTTPR